jgi:hypothetical protein
VVTLLDGFVASAQAEQQSGVSHEQWWSARESLYEHLDRYPTLTWSYEQGGYDKPLDPFEFGLERVLDSIAVLITDPIRDEKRDENACPVCGKPVKAGAKGRPRDYCSRACQQRAYRERTASR